jgi:hypothetical protein
VAEAAREMAELKMEMEVGVWRLLLYNGFTGTCRCCRCSHTHTCIWWHCRSHCCRQLLLPHPLLTLLLCCLLRQLLLLLESCVRAGAGAAARLALSHSHLHWLLHWRSRSRPGYC